MNTKTPIFVFLYSRLIDPLSQGNCWLFNEDYTTVWEALSVTRRSRYFIETPKVCRWSLEEYCTRVNGAKPLNKMFEFNLGSDEDWLGVDDTRAPMSKGLGAQC